MHFAELRILAALIAGALAWAWIRRFERAPERRWSTYLILGAGTLVGVSSGALRSLLDDQVRRWCLVEGGTAGPGDGLFAAVFSIDAQLGLILTDALVGGVLVIVHDGTGWRRTCRIVLGRTLVLGVAGATFAALIVPDLDPFGWRAVLQPAVGSILEEDLMVAGAAVVGFAAGAAAGTLSALRAGAQTFGSP